MKGWPNILSQAWGVKQKQLQRLYDNWIERDFALSRKEDKRKGKIFFNCEKRHNQVFTQLNAYKRERAKDFRDTPDRLNEAELKSKFIALSMDKKFYKDITKRQRIQA
eukprot:10528991-Ditylum_brightwellii.AAC.1